MDKGSAMKAEHGAAGEADESALTEWFCSWDTLEALARDAGKLHEKCGTNCSVEELGQWRERVMAQLYAVLAEEERIFKGLCSAGVTTEPAAGAALGNAA